MSDIDYIRHHITRGDMLLQLAEEASELSQAAAKLLRCENGTNPTAKTHGQCVDDLLEEMADVKSCVDVLLGEFEAKKVLNIEKQKIRRWAERLFASGSYSEG